MNFKHFSFSNILVQNIAFSRFSKFSLRILVNLKNFSIFQHFQAFSVKTFFLCFSSENHLKRTKITFFDFIFFDETGLRNYYFKYIMRLEERTHFDQFEGPLMVDADFSAKSTVLIMGQSQSGKTSFIRYLLQRDFPGSQSADKFVALTHSQNDLKLVSGKEAISRSDSPFKAMACFGSGFVDRFQVSELDCALLEHLTLIDSPGTWFLNELDSAASYYRFWAGKADAIMLVFDAERSDISEHFAKLIVALKGNLQKVRVVLNKADGVGHQQLMRNFGAFVWTLGMFVVCCKVT